MTGNPRIGVALAALALVAGCDGSAATSPTARSDAGASAGATTTGKTETTGADVVDLVPIGSGVALDPATYAVPYVGDEGTADDPRALVEVPEGYFSAGGWVIDDGHDTMAPDEFGDIMFVADVRRVDTRPCGAGGLVRPGASPEDLARTLARAASPYATEPQPVRVGSAQGWYLRVRVPGDCTSGTFRLYRTGEDWAPGGSDRGVLHLWALEVDGRQVLAQAHVFPGETTDPRGLVGMVRHARFADHLPG